MTAMPSRMSKRQDSTFRKKGDEAKRREDLASGRDAFMTRVEGLLDPAYRLATVILLDHAAAEDAVHDATLRAWRQYRRMRGDVTGFRTWFLSIVNAQCRSALRWRMLTLRRGAGGLGEPGPAQDAIVRLPVGSRSALFCYLFLDLPLDEVARVMRTPLSRLRTRVYTAASRLQADLDRAQGTPS